MGVGMRDRGDLGTDREMRGGLMGSGFEQVQEELLDHVGDLVALLNTKEYVLSSSEIERFLDAVWLGYTAIMRVEPDDE